MITTRSPYRISFFGGGTDYEDWYSSNGGAFLSLAINYYTYITLRIKPKFQQKEFRILWRLAEEVQDINDIQHPIVRETLKEFGYEDTGLDISYIGDLPGGAGMGSSSAFTAALIMALKTHIKEIITPYELSKLSYFIEKQKLNETVGIQDQIATSFGGFNKVEIERDGNFQVVPVNLSAYSLNNFVNRLVLVYTGTTRRATDVAEKKVQNMNEKSRDYTKMYEMVSYAQSLLLNDKLDDFGKLMHEAWEIKRGLSDVMSNKVIDDIYDIGINNGALGGKLLGAGGGGFVLFMCKENMREKLISKFNKNSVVPLKISFTGTQVVYNERELI
ncbi:MAG: kinase [Gammaproteobacteria bacterium]|jgi:D-glycero-alpha-D-manno-heptose-7-phosphate kinase